MYNVFAIRLLMAGVISLWSLIAMPAVCSGGNPKPSLDKPRATVGRWAQGWPTLRGGTPELHVSITRQGVLISRAYTIGGRGWKGTLKEAAAMNPKPYLIVHIKRNVVAKEAVRLMSEMSRLYGCSSYQCYIVR
jgi:hypothetical protein